MLAQRMRHDGQVVDERGEPVHHSLAFISKVFDEELDRLLASATHAEGTEESFREARRISEAMVVNGEFDPL
jgi:hypothetical protein